ncbi:MAG: CRTAC1 family protein [Verrucomicrobiae bacterium]|nr:CRTAC1 family protein [Verrucomicrobiae bacterium]
MSSPASRPPSPPDREPLPDADDQAPLDDAIIGRAMRRSAYALIGIVLAIGATLLWFRRPTPAPPPQVTEIRTPVARTHEQAVVPTVRFTDVTASAGIRFTHFTGAEGEKLLPETMGGGGAFFDFDGDGHPDLLLVNGAPWPWAKQPPVPAPTHALYRNDGTGRFTDVTAGSGLDVTFYGMGVACGDFDNDGLVDVFITAVGSNRLFRNLGNGRFEDVTASAGVGGGPEVWSTAAAFVDLDRDGLLDLVVVNYVQWSRDIDFQVGYSLDGRNRAYGPPMNFQGTVPYLYRNEGNGRFTDITAQAGLAVRNPATGVPAAKSLGIAPIDLNGDGWIDLVVANDTVQNLVFTNRHDLTFAEVGARLGVAFDPLGNARGAMGIDTVHHRNDDALAIGIANFANEMTALYVADRPSAIFTDEAIAEGIGPVSRLLLKFGLFFFDYDLDGWPDLLTCNGHLEEEISLLQESQAYRQPAQLFWNAGATDGGFVPIHADRAGPDLFQPIVGRGSAYADIDGDGDLDVLFLQVGGPPILLRNDQNLGHSWIRFRLVGTRANRDAIGALVRVTANGRTQTRQVMPTRSYLSQSELPVTFGLGPGTPRIDSVEIQWPDGSRQQLDTWQVNALNTVRQP